MGRDLGPGMLEIMVPVDKVGLIIGAGGETIKKLRERSGAEISIIQDSSNAADVKPLQITGDPNCIEKAKELVGKLYFYSNEIEESLLPCSIYELDPQCP